ncbi:DedA family protein [Effusibacillus pohliae]|uniref:DedA family protein n=1 Tax=Effusibacillus pohliae TaxID=232270 RepID=UPI00058D364C|nr:DedA family protein [Effusibacillus pohliae]
MNQEFVFHWIAHYGYIGLFTAQVLGIVGIPLPDELLMTFAGFLVSKGELRYWVTLLVAFLGSIVGMSFSYLVGHRFGLPLLEKHGRKISITPEKLEKAEQWFRRFGKLTVTLGYFIPGVRHFTALSAGISKWPYPAFLLYAFPGGLLWVLTFVTLGVFLQDHWLTFSKALHKYLWLAAILAATAAIIGWRIRRFVCKQKAR